MRIMLKNLKEFKLPEIEEKVLKFWKENHIFDKTLKLREKAKPFRFFEGPPTANGRPGIHHVLSRAFKDVMLRYKTMRGYFVRRQAGWDTHGLPVEIEVEKELGLKNKQEIEKFGIAQFNEKAKASVWKYKEEWERLTDRIGFWLELKHPYITYSNNYIESLWWIFNQIAKRKLLTKSFKIVPWCPRCQTPLSSHELGQPGAYRKVKDPSIYVKFEIRNSKSEKRIKEYLLVWTTTPWTLPSNVAVAVNPKLTYTKYKVGNEYLWSFNVPPSLAEVSYGGQGRLAHEGEPEVMEKMSGKRLVGLKYEPLFKVKGPWLANKKLFKVYPADFISTEDGTGLVHIAPAFGEEDMALILKVQGSRLKATDIPITINEQGLVQSGLPGAGRFVKQADKEIIQDLEKRGLLFHQTAIEHDYPFCWRCSAPLLYLARSSWFIEMSKLRNDLLKNNQKINWIPEHIKEGRFGEWLREVKDWAISRDRYWGTPLPIWQCGKCDSIRVAGGLKDLDDFRYFGGNQFFLLRHGEAEHNVKDIIASGPERGKQISRLTEKGKEDAERSVKNLKKFLGKKKLDFIFSSPYLRTKETAQAVAKATGAKIIFDDRLAELNTGIFNWRTIKEYHQFFANELERFTKAPAGGENLNEVKARMFAAILDINSKYQNKNILIVSHGDPLWLLEGAMKGLTNEEILVLDYIHNNGEVKKVDLHNWPYNAEGNVDLHRPYIDQIYLSCGKCKNRMVRVKEVADVWFDSGAMPFAQFHYPWNCAQTKSLKLKVKSLEDCIDFPADYISEGIDQTRGWFYTLLAISTALGLGPSYLNVITLGLVLDKNGQKMSKSKGNVVDPWQMIEKYGSDVVRWYFYTINPPAELKRFDEADLGKMYRKFIMLVYNSFVFLDTYGVKESRVQIEESKNILDKWILGRLAQTISKTTKFLESYDVGSAGHEIESLTDDLSRWYIRRSRRRFQKPESQKDLEIVSGVLGKALLEISKLISPFTPFFAEALYQSINNRKQLSVHLEDWPKAEEKFLDSELSEKMEEVRRIASLALALRAEKGVKVRQPLAALEIKTNKLNTGDKDLLDILKDEVNVKAIKFNFQMKEEVILDLTITSELREEGILRELVRMVQDLRQDAGLVPQDRICFMVEAGKETADIFSKNEAFLKREVGAEILELKKGNKFDAEISSKLDDQPIWVALRKV